MKTISDFGIGISDFAIRPFSGEAQPSTLYQLPSLGDSSLRTVFHSAFNDYNIADGSWVAQLLTPNISKPPL
ncbi:MAG TPA: hypothetical protein VGH74_07405 [Planctomycetaceae bacterium]|jgi:hypothetical protein